MKPCKPLVFWNCLLGSKAIAGFLRSACRSVAAVTVILISTASGRAQSLADNLRLAIVSSSSGIYDISWFGEGGQRYQMQSSSDLIQPWTNAAAEVTGADGLITLEDGLISDLQKFYRVAVVHAVRSFFKTGQLGRNDDGSSASTIPIGFTINLFGANSSALWVNNNGNVTFTSSLSAYTPLPLQNGGLPIIAPFWADADTRPSGSGITNYTSGIFIGSRKAFVVTWPDVGYYNQKTNKLNKFQLVLIERADVSSGDFDIEFNYDRVQWETGDHPTSGGVNGLGGKSARVGLSNGSTQNIELAGSGSPGALLDTQLTTGLIYNSRNSVIPGRYIFQVRGGAVLGAINVDAGPNTTLGSGVRVTTLAGSATDPNGPLTAQWKLLSGPAAVAFSDPAILTPTVTFSTIGTYTLQLTVTSTSDPQRTGADAVVIIVQ